MSYKIISNYFEIDEVLPLDEGKSIGQIFAEELDKLIANDIAEVFKKYFPQTKINHKKVLNLARRLIAEEMKRGAE